MITDKKYKITNVVGQYEGHMELMGKDDDIYISYGFIIMPHLSCPDCIPTENLPIKVILTTNSSTFLEK